VFDDIKSIASIVYLVREIFVGERGYASKEFILERVSPSSRRL
jgi:hypothetical protein